MRSIPRTLFGFLIGGLLSWLHLAPASRRTTTRRGFVRNATLGAVLIVLAEIGFGFVRFFWPNKTTAFGQSLDVAATDIPPVNGAPYRYTPGKFYLIHNQEGLMALYQKCPHLGCAVPYNGPADSPEAFACPCHGSLYDYNGTRTGGPAPRSMDYMTLSVNDDGSVSVNTGDIKTRDAYEPSQATRYPG